MSLKISLPELVVHKCGHLSGICCTGMFCWPCYDKPAYQRRVLGHPCPHCDWRSAHEGGTKKRE